MVRSCPPLELTAVERIGQIRLQSIEPHYVQYQMSLVEQDYLVASPSNSINCKVALISGVCSCIAGSYGPGVLVIQDIYSYSQWCAPRSRGLCLGIVKKRSANREVLKAVNVDGISVILMEVPRNIEGFRTPDLAVLGNDQLV